MPESALECAAHFAAKGSPRRARSAAKPGSMLCGAPRRRGGGMIADAASFDPSQELPTPGRA
eukprot:11611151-Alexandrium_andersonii.AAC.1